MISRPGQVAGGERASVADELVPRPGEDHLAAALARARTELHAVVGRFDEAPVVLHDDHGVAGVRQLPAQLGQAADVPGVEPDRRLVEDVERADELGAELGGEPDPLGLAAGEGPGLAVERQVSQADPPQERHLPLEPGAHVPGDFRLPGGQLEPVEPRGQLVHGEAADVGDRAAADRHRQRLRLEPGAPAARAEGLAAVAGEEDPHVELVAVAFHLLEEAADPAEVVVALLDPAPDLLRQLPIRRVDVQLAAPGDAHAAPSGTTPPRDAATAGPRRRPARGSDRAPLGSRRSGAGGRSRGTRDRRRAGD